MKSSLLQNRCHHEENEAIEVMFIVDENDDEKHYISSSAAYRIDSCEINKVKTFASINRQKRTDAAVVLGTKIYCIGTARKRDSWRIDSFEVYCRTTDTWSVLESAPEINYGFCAFMGKIYAFGGCSCAASVAYSPEELQ